LAARFFRTWKVLHADQSFGDAVALGNLASVKFLADAAGVEIFDRFPGPLSQFRGCFAKGVGDPSRVRFEILKQHLTVMKPRAQTSLAGQPAERAAKADPIESGQNPLDVFVVTCEKRIHGVTPCGVAERY
jgi:hypothetical protein